VSLEEGFSAPVHFISFEVYIFAIICKQGIYSIKSYFNIPSLAKLLVQIFLKSVKSIPQTSKLHVLAGNEVMQTT
jgi:hypothetical protein